MNLTRFCLVPVGLRTSRMFGEPPFVASNDQPYPRFQLNDHNVVLRIEFGAYKNRELHKRFSGDVLSYHPYILCRNTLLRQVTLFKVLFHPNLSTVASVLPYIKLHLIDDLHV